jgi:Lon protease-like protein
MSVSGDFSFSPAQFSGQARLFPLPNLVMFPQVMQPLHIFEPRYRAMMEESLADDRLMALAMLAPGWESQYEGRPKLRDHACLCRVATYQKLPDGCFNALVLGVRRVRLVEELPASKPFREARVELLEDVYSLKSSTERPNLQRDLLAAFKRILPSLPHAHEQLDQLLGAQIPLGMLTDIVAYTLDFPIELKERMLAELDVDVRASALLEKLRCGAMPSRPGKSHFPPDFSAN